MKTLRMDKAQGTGHRKTKFLVIARSLPTPHHPHIRAKATSRNSFIHNSCTYVAAFFFFHQFLSPSYLAIHPQGQSSRCTTSSFLSLLNHHHFCCCLCCSDDTPLKSPLYVYTPEFTLHIISLHLKPNPPQLPHSSPKTKPQGLLVIAVT